MWNFPAKGLIKIAVLSKTGWNQVLEPNITPT